MWYTQYFQLFTRNYIFYLLMEGLTVILTKYGRKLFTCCMGTYLVFINPLELEVFH